MAWRLTAASGLMQDDWAPAAPRGVAVAVTSRTAAHGNAFNRERIWSAFPSYPGPPSGAMGNGDNRGNRPGPGDDARPSCTTHSPFKIVIRSGFAGAAGRSAPAGPPFHDNARTSSRCRL